MKIYLYFVEFSNNIQKQTEKALFLFGPFYFQMRFSDSETGSQRA